jgi:hypothetical protein
MNSHLFELKLQRRAVAEKLTPDVVLSSLDSNGATTKYGEIVAQVGMQLGLGRAYDYALYYEISRILQRLRRVGRVELIKGVGAGWRLSGPELIARITAP